MSQAKDLFGYSVQKESKSLLLNGIIGNPLHLSTLPNGIMEAAEMVEYSGSPFLSIPVNLRFAESISAIQGFQGAMLNVLLKEKYGVPYQKILINTDHAQHFIFSPMDTFIDPSNRVHTPQEALQRYEKYFSDCDLYQSYQPHATQLTIECSNIYKTKDGKYYHIHGNMNPIKTQQALSLPLSPSPDLDDRNAIIKLYASLVSIFDASELDTLMNEQYGQSGTVCYSPEEYFATEHGKANANVGLYEVKGLILSEELEIKELPPTWWEGGTPERPLQGLKVLDLTRIIAGQTITRSLAAFGAHVLRITSPTVTDMSMVNLDLGWGKWNAHLDLKSPEGRRNLQELIKEADVVVDGYRPGVSTRLGFGWEDVGRIWKERGRGGVFAREICYGWNGPWKDRSGWQQISDACCGSSYLYGKGMGLDEPVSPVFPHSDFSTGVAGATGILQALIERGNKGGSYIVDCAINYYSQWLVRTASTYPPHIWNSLWEFYGRPTFRHFDNLPFAIPVILKLIKDRACQSQEEEGKGLFNPEFYENRENKALGVKVRCIKPVLVFPEGRVKLGYNVGSRPNGTDKAVWPQDLITEVIE